jgi:hypothetical protein
MIPGSERAVFLYCFWRKWGVTTPLCIWLWPWGGREFLFLLVAYDRGNGKTEKEFFLILAMLPVLIVVEVNSI